MSKYISSFHLMLASMFCFFTLLVPSFSFAQLSNADTLKFYFGPYAGYNLNFHIANFRVLATDCPTCVPEDYGFHVGGGFAFGGLFEYLLLDAGQPTKMRIGARLGYSDVSANFVQEEYFANIANPNAGEPVAGTSEHNLEASISQINFAPYFAYSFTDNLIGNVGLNLGYMMTSKFNQWEELTHPDYAVFLEENSKIRNEYKDIDIPSANSLQFGILLGIGYELPIGKYARLMPELQYNLNFNSVSEVDWNTSSLRIGLAAKFPIVSPGFVQPELHYQRDTTIEYKMGIEQPEIVLLDSRRELQDNNDTLVVERYVKYMPKTASLESDLSYYVLDKGQRSSVANIIIEEFETTEYFPFLPIVFFADGNSNLEQTKMRHLASSDVSSFKEGELQHNNAMLLYPEMLNILGQRMSQKPSANITIRGYSSEVGQDAANKQIGMERATAVKNYLVNVWKISQQRIKVEQAVSTVRRAPEDKSYNDVVEENQRAQIYSDDLDLLMPVVLSRIEKISNPPEIHFDLSGSSEAGLKSYNFTISQSGSDLRKYEGNTTGNSFKDTRVWNVTEMPVPVFETPLSATLVLTDDLSQTSESKKELTVSQITIKSKSMQAIDSLNMRIERYSLCLFDFDKADLTLLHNKILNEVKKSIHPDSELSIDGYADRTGELQYNIDLAGRRCESVNRFISQPGTTGAEIDAIGNQRLLYDNNTPEGRALCRTVRIEIRTPNK